jgi:hypothetical protein
MGLSTPPSPLQAGHLSPRLNRASWHPGRSQQLEVGDSVLPQSPGILASRAVPAPVPGGISSLADPGTPMPRGNTGPAGPYYEKDVRVAVPREGDKGTTASFECDLARRDKHLDG